MESRPDVGISGCKLIKGDGKLDLACRRRFPNPANSFKRLFLLNRTDYNYTDIDENQSMEVDSVVGAFLLIRRVGKSDTSENRISGASDFRLPTSDYLDEDFFMYGEDLDLCWRCKEAGYKVWYYPKTVATHYKGESSSKEPFLMLKAFHDSMWIFYKKHYYKNYPFFLNWLVYWGIYLRLGVLVFINLFKSDPRVSK
jgi:GT2 family glycosyltransferase